MLQNVAHIATIVAVFVAGYVFLRERRYQKSKESLESTLAGYEQAYDLIGDGNNDRITWILAARILRRAQEISQTVTQQIHKQYFQIQKDHYRILFADILGFDNREKRGAFFYGIEDQNVDLDQAAINSQQAPAGQAAIRAIPENVLYAFWKAAEFPDRYADPLEGSGKFDDDTIAAGTFRALWPGLARYLEHVHMYRVLGGDLRRRRRNGNGGR